MRRKDRQLSDREQIEAIIARSQVCRLALFDDEFPYLVPMSFGYEGGCLYIHSAIEGKKIDLLARDNRVGFEMEADAEVVRGPSPCKWSVAYSSVVGRGTAHVIQDMEEKRKGLEVIFRHYSDEPCPLPDEGLKRVAVIRIDIESMTGKSSVPSTPV